MILVYLFMLMAGALPLAMTIRYYFIEKRIRREGVSAMGVVSSIHSRTMTKGPTRDEVTIEYGSLIGSAHRKNLVTRQGKFKRGQTVQVRYLPEQPSRVIINDAPFYWPGLVFTALVFLLMIYAVYQINGALK